MLSSPRQNTLNDLDSTSGSELGVIARLSNVMYWVEPFMYFTFRLYCCNCNNILCKRIGAASRDFLKIASSGL